MKNTIILILFVLFALTVSYLVACAVAWIISFLFVIAFNAAWPNVWVLGLLIWLIVGLALTIKKLAK